MNVNVLENSENKLFNRKEVVAEISFDSATPKRSEVKTNVCTKVAANPDMAVLRSIRTGFGKKIVIAKVHVYSNADLMKKNEPVYVLVRDGLMAKPEKKKKAAAPAAKKK